MYILFAKVEYYNNWQGEGLFIKTMLNMHMDGLDNSTIRGFPYRTQDEILDNYL